METDKIFYVNDIPINIYTVEYVNKIKSAFGFIYITTNLINKKRYIGQKKIVKNDSHWKTYFGSGRALKKAVAKYGKENFDRKIIDIAFSFEELNELELFYTKVFSVVTDRGWYNLCYGGGGVKGAVGITRTEETKQKLRDAKLGEKNPNYGRVYTEQEIQALKKKMSGEGNPMYGKNGELSPNYGKKHSQETKDKMRAAALGEKNHNYGRKMPEEQKEKLREYNRINGNPHSKITAQYSLDGKLIKIFPNAAQASTETNISHSSICAVCRGKRKVAGGSIWRYYEKQEDVLEQLVDL